MWRPSTWSTAPGRTPIPPRAIRSANGKIYLHWHFYRDGRQCSPAGADPDILENASADADKATALEMPRPVHIGATSPPTSEPAAGGGRRLERLHGDDEAHRARRASLNREVANAEASEGRSGERSTPEPSAPEPRGPSAAPPNPANPVAQTTALRWFTALAANDTRQLLEMAALPFKTNGKEVRNKGDLSSMLSDLSSEGVRRPQSVQLVTAARLRAAIGKLPPSLDDTASSQLYSVVEMGAGSKDMLILILGQRGDAWRPVGMVRR